MAELDSALNKWIDAIPEHRASSLCSPSSTRSNSFRRSALGPNPRRPCFLPPICRSLLPLLPAPNHDPSSVHPFATQALPSLLPLPCDMHERGEVMQSCCGFWTEEGIYDAASIFPGLSRIFFILLVRMATDEIHGVDSDSGIYVGRGVVVEYLGS